MTSNEIRQQFLDFFKSKQHAYVHSAPLVLKNDPTLMFSNSGMVQFKDYFLGNKVAENKRVANSQKCLRVTGKHNDLEDVGHDTYHHTMFEMLGNWSFGDYFKADAIDWAWELLTEVYKLPKERLYVTVFGGDQKEGLEPDNEAKDLWKKHVSEDRILYGNKKDNFWEMGDQGPCGPCSEIHIDLREASEIAKKGGRELVNNDDPQVIEIWNLVFMQFNRKADASLEPLPDKHVDTGMGFERLVRAIEMKKSNYDTDVFRPLIQFLEQTSGKNYYEDEAQNGKACIAMRVVADHIRAVAFAISDGQLPSNNKAGYVIRRILRRAVRYGYSFLGFKEPFMFKMVEILAKQMETIFPELKAQQAFVENVIREEETSFLRTLDKGISLFDDIKFKVSNTVIPGKTVFELYDTFGFPVDLTALLAKESGMQIDMKGFEAEMQIQKTRSRAAAESEKGDWLIPQLELLDFGTDEEISVPNLGEGVTTHQTKFDSDFVGYDLLECQATILKYRQLTEKKTTFYQVVLDKTPFYAESGGQVGDTGFFDFYVKSENKTLIVNVFDTKKENDLIIHFVSSQDFDKIKSYLQDFNSYQLTAKINVEKRRLTENNHSATHLLHAALRDVLGTHVAQKGSLVNENVLRFDFSHFAKMTDEEIERVESIVNQKIRENIALQELRSVPIEEAKAMGAMALFGEKYGNFVRTIIFDRNFSVELCGGTHVSATGKIGFFKVTSESSVAAGVRRIEAITAQKAEDFVKAQLDLLEKAKEALKNPKDLLKAITDLQDERSRLEKEVERLQAKELQVLKAELLGKIEQKGNIKFLIAEVEVPKTDSLKTLAFQFRQQFEDMFLVLAAKIDDKAHIAVMVSDNLLKNNNLDASKIVKDLAKHIEGGGGGQAFFATATGKNVRGLKEVLEVSRGLV